MAPSAVISAETLAMIDHQYAELRADHGLINLAGCALGDGGCRRQYFPIAIDAGQDPEAEKQGLIRSHLWARTIGGNGGFAALWDGTHQTSLGRVCVGPGAEGTYFLTIFADPTISGDGRLSGSEDGYMSKNAQNNAVDGVLKANDATEANPIVAAPKAARREAVAPKFADVPVNSWRCISKKTPSVQTSTHMYKQVSQIHVANQ